MASDQKPRVRSSGWTVDRPLRDEGFPQLRVIRHGILRAGQDDTEDEKGDGGIVQVEYRVYAQGREGMSDDSIGDAKEGGSGATQPVWLVSLVVLLVGLFLTAQSDQLSQWKRLVSGTLSSLYWS